MNHPVPAPADLANAIRQNYPDVVDRMLEHGADALAIIENENQNPRGITVVWQAVLDGKLRYLPKLLGKNHSHAPLAIAGALDFPRPGEVDPAPRDIDVFEMLAHLPRNQFVPALDAFLGAMAPESPALARSLWRLCEVLITPGIGHARVGNVNNMTDALTVINKGAGPFHLPPAERPAAWQSLFAAEITASGLPSQRWGASFLSLCLHGHASRTVQMLQLAFADGLSPETTVDGHPILILAIGRKNPRAVEVILEAGADVRRVHEMQMGYGIERGDALYYAAMTSNDTCLHLLEAFAARSAIRAAVSQGARTRGRDGAQTSHAV